MSASTSTQPASTQPASTQPASTSPLDHPPARFAAEPFFDQTVSLLRCVRDHDFATLSELCDDDFGIVDIEPSGSARVVRTRAQWEEWFTELFLTLEHLGATTDSEILDYHAVTSATMGYSVLEFRQFLTIGSYTATFDCITTIVWKHTPHGWREARWHGSVISSHVPPELAAAAA